MALRPFVPAALVRSLIRNHRRLPPAPHSARAEAALLLVDISGFTALTEKLAVRGREGAEEIAAVVTKAFTRPITTIEAHGGSIQSFGGDALFAIFEGAAPVSRAARAADRVAASFAKHGAFSTSAGRVRLDVSQALHYGAVTELHVGWADRRRYLVAGASVSALARFEAMAQGHFVMSAAARGQLKRERRARRAGAPRMPARVSEKLLAPYVEPSLRPLLRTFAGAYRRVAVIFLETKGTNADRLHRFYLALADVLDRFDGTLLKTDLSTAGTKWIAVFGIPQAHEEDPDRAARAALQAIARAPKGLAVRAGLAAGVVANVVLGIGATKSFDIMGDCVNTAARALGEAAWGEILATEGTRQLVSGIDTEDRGLHAVKGKSESLHLHALLGARARAPAIRVSAPMIGRDRELSQVVAALERAKDGQGSLIGIRGEAGLGKSRLKWEAVARARALGFEVHEGRAIPFGGMAYFTIASLMRAVLGLPEGAAKEQVLATVDQSADRLGMRRVDRHHLADVLGARAEDSPIANLKPQDVRLNAMIAIRAFCQALAAETPRLFVIEDLHWADGASREAAEWLAKVAGGSRFVLLLLYRPSTTVKGDASYAPPPGITEIFLSELGAEAVGELLRAHLGTVPARVSRLVVERAGGNPFYVEELVRHLLEVGILVRAEEGYTLAREPAPADLPASVEGVIAARLDRLPDDVRSVAQHASIIGRSFLFELLAHFPEIARTAGPGVAELCRREITFEKQREPYLEYIWKHALTRDVAYEGILAARRRQLHREVADAIEALLGKEGFLAMLGHHRERAGQSDAARECYLAAAREAAARYAHEETERLYQSYLALVARPSRESVAARIDLGERVLQLMGRMQEAEGQHTRALEEAREIGDRRGEAEALRALGFVYTLTGRMADSRSSYEDALSACRKVGERRLEGSVVFNLAGLHMDQGRNDEARSLFEQALAIVREAGDRRLEGRVIANLAILHAHQGQLKEARSLFEQALAIQREVGDRCAEGTVIGNLAGLCLEQGAPGEARVLFEQALAIQLEVGDRRGEGTVLSNLAVLHDQQGRMEEARSLYEQALAIDREVDNRRGMGSNLGNLAILHHEQGRMEEARSLYEQALAIKRELGNRHGVGGDLANLASLHAEQGRMEEASCLYEEALAINREVGDRRLEGSVLLGLGAHEAITSGALEEAEGYLERGEMLLHEASDKMGIGKVLCARGHVALAAGRDARDSLQRASKLAEDLGAGGESALGKAVARLGRAVSASRAGKPILCGHCPEDLTDAQLRWLREHRPTSIPPELRDAILARIAPTALR